ncbi:MAG: NAD(P)H-hydrate dehydratase [Thermodesulfobacteriota bacterium]|nr:NAD(P)H-hydrate dehydratase [Thermodesulfobacteriota bacterium]
MILVNAAEMQQMDKTTIEAFGIPGRVLMENAGRGATRWLMENFPDVAGRRIGVLAGRGNNGGDGFVIARYLFRQGAQVTVYLLSDRDRVAGDAAANLALLEPLGVPVICVPDAEVFAEQQKAMAHESLLVDAILGTGLNSDVSGFFRTVIEFVNAFRASGRPVFAVDIPSGLHTDTGKPCGICVTADATATFAFAKTGHLLFPGAAYTGALRVIDIGIPNHIAAEADPGKWLLTPSLVAGYLTPRSATAHKGNTGHLLVAAGTPGKTGAAAMTAMSAMRAGAGLVTLAVPESINAIVEPMVLEPMTLPVGEKGATFIDNTCVDAILSETAGKSCMALGPGIGTADATRQVVHRLIKESDIPLVIDADGLSCIAGDCDVLKGAKRPVVLTPHPGEMARLAGTTAADVQENRLKHASEFAERYNVHVVLKGAGTVIAHPDGRIFLNRTGNPGMAAGGMGDVLTGVIAGLVCQGYPCGRAARIGTYVHGAAADILSRRLGRQGFLAADVMAAVPEALNRLFETSSHAHADGFPHTDIFC